MIQQKSILKFLSIFLLSVMISCAGGQKKTSQEETHAQTSSVPKIEINSEAQTLLKTLNKMGDYANSRNFPSLIKPTSVHDELDGNILIVDLRSKKAFADGHIKNAVNVAFSDIPDYFVNQIKPSDYDKIVMVCYAGQYAAYTTSLLRLAGYGNVYSMKWGMSGWNKHFADQSWLTAVSSDYQNQLETTENEKDRAEDLPKMSTGQNLGNKILQTRIDSLFAAGLDNVFISAKKVFEKPSDYYVINYDRKDKYESGHIPGAIRYKPGATLGIVSEMQTIPADKDVVVYCNTGQNSGFATAYLRLFGYHAKSLIFGNNSFMFDRMKDQESKLSWVTFTMAEVNDFPYVTN